MAEVIQFPKKRESTLEMEEIIALMEESEELDWNTVQEVENVRK